MLSVIDGWTQAQMAVRDKGCDGVRPQPRSTPLSPPLSVYLSPSVTPSLTPTCSHRRLNRQRHQGLCCVVGAESSVATRHLREELRTKQIIKPDWKMFMVMEAACFWRWNKEFSQRRIKRWAQTQTANWLWCRNTNLLSEPYICAADGEFSQDYNPAATRIFPDLPCR